MRARTPMVLASAVLLVVSVVLFAMSHYWGGAASSEFLSPVDSVAEEDAIVLLESTAQPESVATAAELASMVAGWTEPLVGSPGWLHVREEIAQDNMKLGTLPDGSIIPSNYVFDSWYLLDDGGYVIAGVSRMMDREGRAIQTSVYEDATWTNITFDFTSVEGPFKPNMDHGLTLDLTSPGRITGFDEREILYNGEPATEVTTFEDFSSPTKVEGFPGAIAGVVKRAVFDSATGALKTLETIFRTKDGKEVSVSLVSVLTSERADAPPAEVLDLFQEKPQ